MFFGNPPQDNARLSVESRTGSFDYSGEDNAPDDREGSFNYMGESSEGSSHGDEDFHDEDLNNAGQHFDNGEGGFDNGDQGYNNGEDGYNNGGEGINLGFEEKYPVGDNDIDEYENGGSSEVNVEGVQHTQTSATTETRRASILDEIDVDNLVYHDNYQEGVIYDDDGQNDEDIDNATQVELTPSTVHGSKRNLSGDIEVPQDIKRSRSS